MVRRFGLWMVCTGHAFSFWNLGSRQQQQVDGEQAPSKLGGLTVMDGRHKPVVTNASRGSVSSQPFPSSTLHTLQRKTNSRRKSSVSATQELPHSATQEAALSTAWTHWTHSLSDFIDRKTCAVQARVVQFQSKIHSVQVTTTLSAQVLTHCPLPTLPNARASLWYARDSATQSIDSATPSNTIAVL